MRHALLAALLVLCGAVTAADLILLEDTVLAPAGAVVVLEGPDYIVVLSDELPTGGTLLDRDAEENQYLQVWLRASGSEETLSALGEVIFRRDNLYIVRRDEDAPPPFTLEGIHFILPLDLAPRRIEGTGFDYPPLPLDDAFLYEVLDQVCETTIKGHIQDLEDFVTRFTVRIEYSGACVYVNDFFTDLGLQSEIQPFSFNSWYFDGSPRPSYNVVAEQPGVLYPEIIYIICGHLDSIVWPGENQDFAPGADDNASGTATVMEAARILSQYEFDVTLRYIAFGAEEVGLHGSTEYATAARARDDDIRGVINIDMILYDGSDRYLTFVPYDSQSTNLALYLERFADHYVPDLNTNVVLSPGTRYSDHAPFWDKGYPALLMIEEDVYSNPYYHTVDDLLVNYEDYWPFGTDNVRVAVGTLAALASGHSFSDVGLAELRGRSVEEGVLLDWNVEGDASVVLQRNVSGDWTPIFERPLSGSSGAYLDTDAAPGENTYRLRLTEAGGRVSYTEALSVTRLPARHTLSLDLWPVPSSGSLNVALVLPEASSVELRLYDLAGRRLLEESLGRLPAGESRASLTLDHLDPGVYLLRAVGESDAVSRRLVITR